MFIHRRRGWELPESLATPEPIMLGRRALMGGVAAGLAAGATASKAEAETNSRYPAGRPVTPEQDATTYNNFYEFGEDKSIWRAAQRLPVAPWQIELAGMIDKPRKMDLADLLKQVQVEDRVYRHRCVEAWAMTVPWTGFSLASLLKVAQPTASAKYVVFESAALPKVMPGLRSSLYPWPYVEACTMQEAGNDLAFMVTGMYGKDLPKQNGAPLRLHLPWKYGFKSGKSIVKISFTDTQPETMWHAIQPEEYGFWANVNPDVPHPRWSQASERLLGTGERVPTVIWNGYGEWVAGMYADKKNEKLFT
ncbi:protein-methionine-sulfoxide reductase catalytic subunit MsrP [Acidisphaera sp. L21]|uniref:protein-methionine-sulfoxide reductase catalytic subunit MsrP n=1 Tax=Acidisphaera sp. L21 TaxID=1641851 RepID=UPI00131E21EE|nr:protein-methionine-sulfoxide reductase catalytic subunit MsrP [Acidisphaera sp. L21]